MKSISRKFICLITILSVFVIYSDISFAEETLYSKDELMQYAIDMENKIIETLNQDIDRIYEKSIHNINNYIANKTVETEKKLAIYSIELEKEAKIQILNKALEDYAQSIPQEEEDIEVSNESNLNDEEILNNNEFIEK